mgnify:CR=1 FL=1
MKYIDKLIWSRAELFDFFSTVDHPFTVQLSVWMSRSFTNTPKAMVFLSIMH